MSSRLGNKKKNLEKINSIANRARKKGADIVVLPELCLTGNNIRDRSYELAEEIPGPCNLNNRKNSKGNKHAYYFWNA